MEPEWIDDQLQVTESMITGLKKSQLEHEKRESQLPAAFQKKEPENPEDLPMSKKIGNFLSLGGDVLKKGIIRGGEWIGAGIRQSKPLTPNHTNCSR